MAYDLVIRGGVIVDGSGRPRYRADVGISGERIARIGRIRERGAREIDADGHVVTPGFVDGHTHMDAQVFWDPLGSSSCWHGVTSVVMGNCGFTLAPSVAGEEHLVLANLERAEDLPAAAMAAGIRWTWEGFPGYLDAVDAQPKAINYAAQVGHSALRTSVMGERAFVEQASEEDLATMARVLEEALRAGAVGFTTSISDHHWTSTGNPVASRVGTWDELCALVAVLGTAGVGVFELATDTESTESPDGDRARRFYDKLGQLAVRSGVPVTYGLRHQHQQIQLEAFDATAAAGGRMFGQCRSEPVTLLHSFRAELPVDHLAVWRDVRARSLREQCEALRDPILRARLVAAATDAAASLERLQIVTPAGPGRTLGAEARARGVGAVELMIDLALQTDLAQVFVRSAPWDERDALAAMQHPWTVMTFSDEGAHVSQICGTSIQTGLLATWVRDRQAFTLEAAVRMLTLVPAFTWGIPERGLLREGMIADLNVFDADTVAPGVPTIELDLPGGAPRVQQKATGFLATVVGGEETFHDGEPTGARPGRLLRGPLAPS